MELLLIKTRDNSILNKAMILKNKSNIEII